MYKCCECGRIFDEPVELVVQSHYWGVPDDTVYWESPCCHEAFEEYSELEEDEEEGALEYAV